MLHKSLYMPVYTSNTVVKLITRTVFHVDYCLSTKPSSAHAHDSISRIKNAKQIYTGINRAKIIVYGILFI